MQLGEAESETLATEIVRLWSGAPSTTVVLCPSQVALEKVGDILRGTSLVLGAQDAFWEDKGAFTGEISPKTLKELGCEFCIVGHSERRAQLGETDAMVNKKVLALLRHGIIPIICVGETLAEREEGKRETVVTGQVRAALAGVKLVGVQRIIIAYEPRWAIGHKAVASKDAAEMHRLIRENVQLPKERCFVIYGGAVDAKNIVGFVAMPEIQGVLVGGASLRAEEFVAIAKAAAKTQR